MYSAELNSYIVHYVILIFSRGAIMVKKFRSPSNAINYLCDTNKCKRVLMVLSSVNVDGGVQSKIMDIYRKIDKNRVQFDFIVQSKSQDTFTKEINELGGNVFYFGELSDIGATKFLMNYLKVLKNIKYKAVHSYLNVNDGIILGLAKLKGVEIRISHSRGAYIKEGYKKKFFKFFKYLIKLTSTKNLACSKHAGCFLYDNNTFEVIPNGFDYEKFTKNNRSDLEDLKNRIGLCDDQLIIGHIGRFSKEKNHIFLIGLCTELKKKEINFKMVLVGDGELKKDIQAKASELLLDDNIYFAGSQLNVETYYQLFDIFLFPSLHEGFGNVAVEAQATNTKVIASTGVSKEVDLGLGLIEFISLEDRDSWVNLILNNGKKLPSVSVEEINKSLFNKGFSIEGIIEKYYHIYQI
jgi:glycosyltransferase EpsF